MKHSRLSFSKSRRLNTSIKVAALLAGLAFVTVVLEQPRLTAAPKQPFATAEQSHDSAQDHATGGAMAERAANDEAMLRASASEQLPVFFPSLFAPPAGAVEEQPPSF